jgi:hypothetical protein
MSLFPIHSTRSHLVVTTQSHFHPYHDSSCLQATSHLLIFSTYLIPGTSHRRQWTDACLRCQSSNPVASISAPRHLNPNEETDLYRHRPGLSSPLSLCSGSKGVSEYLKILAARIDAPLLDDFDICFFHQLVFVIPQITRFCCHPKSLRYSSLDLGFNSYGASIFLSSSAVSYTVVSHLWCIHCERSDWQVFSLAQIRSQILPFHSSVNSLIIESSSRPDPDNMDPTLWLQLFHSFPSYNTRRAGTVYRRWAHGRISHRSVPIATQPFHYRE